MSECADNLGFTNTADAVASRIALAMAGDGPECIVTKNEIEAMAVALIKAHDILISFCGDERFTDEELNPMFLAFYTEVRKEGERS